MAVPSFSRCRARAVRLSGDVQIAAADAMGAAAGEMVSVEIIKFPTASRPATGKVVEVLGPIGREMGRLMADPGYIDGVLRRGAERASAIAYPVLREAQAISGLLRP